MAWFNGGAPVKNEDPILDSFPSHPPERKEKSFFTRALYAVITYTAGIALVALIVLTLLLLLAGILDATD